MKHEYHIVWFEDDEDFVADTREFFTEELRNLGFRLKLTHEEDIRKFDDIDFSNVDLILSDLNMDSDSTDDDDDTGKTLIELVRDRGILTEIFFYSGAPKNLEASVQELSKNISHIQRLGIHAGRKGIEKKIIEFIEASIRKLEDLNNMRGLIISQAIELENDIIQICSSLLPDPATKDSEPDTYSVLHKRVDRQFDCKSCKKRFSILDADDLSLEVLLEKQFLTTSDKLQVLRGHLKTIKSNCNDTQTDLINRLLKHPTLELDLIHHRNIYAHQPVETSDGEQVLRSINKLAKDVTHNKNWCANIRKNFLDYADLLDELRNSFQAS